MDKLRPMGGLAMTRITDLIGKLSPSGTAARSNPYRAGRTRLTDLIGAGLQHRGGGVSSTRLRSDYVAPIREGLEGLVESYNQAFGEAKAANEQRYQQLLDIANATTNQRLADIRSDSFRRESSAMQRLAQLGMSNTTIAPTVKMGFEREKQASLNRAADSMQQTKLGIIERRKDAYPDASIVAQFAQSAGQASPGIMKYLAPVLSQVRQ